MSLLKTALTIASIALTSHVAQAAQYSCKIEHFKTNPEGGIETISTESKLVETKPFYYGTISESATLSYYLDDQGLASGHVSGGFSIVVMKNYYLDKVFVQHGRDATVIDYESMIQVSCSAGAQAQ